MKPSLKQQLKQWKLDYQEVKQIAEKSKKKKKPENFSARDLRELMGQNRSTYKRHNGAFRQRERG
ncbi:hypothetical protein [Peribacillus asahii]|uniref:hypothetical protein n=1 Tax=Peribacillus asahii TaxID=228899 RepID=UPI00207B0D6F|nr:hypothetical protein [Peribacillus asahii]USK61319.1 hypothetical protein LIT37_08390 [Peribacillus asahii]